MSASAPQARSARQFLRKNLKASTSDIPPRHFASAANESGLHYGDLATVLGRMYAGGQGDDFYREQAIEQSVAGGA